MRACVCVCVCVHVAPVARAVQQQAHLVSFPAALRCCESGISASSALRSAVWKVAFTLVRPQVPKEVLWMVVPGLSSSGLHAVM